MHKFLIIFTVLVSCSSAVAQLFSAEEVAHHRANVRLVTQTSAKCLDRIYADHVRFYKQWKVSKYYGARRQDYKTDAGRRATLASYGYSPSQIQAIAPQLTPTACISLAMNCLEEGFRAAGEQATWNKIARQLAVDGKFYGTDLQKLLQQLGWKLYYWNPNPANNQVWDEEDRSINPLTDQMIAEGKSWNPVWGGHTSRYNSVMTRGIYYQSHVDNARDLVGFGTRPPAAFKNIPFFVGIAHSGYHVFPGRYGEVIEAHSMRNLKSADNLEFSAFDPLGRGGPKWTATEKYRSGLIAVPEAF